MPFPLLQATRKLGPAPSGGGSPQTEMGAWRAARPRPRPALSRDRTSKGRRQKQAEPLNRGSIERMLEVKTPGRLHRRVTEAKREVPLIALRNAALVAVAYDTLLRRTELVPLYIGDPHRGADGSGAVLVRRSKADQEGEGAIKYLAPDTMAHIEA